MRYYITGASGFIGTNLIESLVDRGADVFCSDMSPLKNELLYDKVNFELLNLLDRDSLSRSILSANPDYVVHLGARTDLLGNSIEDYPANTLGVQNIVDACRSAASIKKVVMASSRLVFRIGATPNGAWDYSATTAYGKSKVAGEKIIRDSGCDWNWCIVRPTSIWGPWFGIPYRTFFDSIRKGSYIHPKNQTILKSFGYIGNCVAQIISLLEADEAKHQAFFLADYNPIDVYKFACAISEAFGKGRCHEIPISLMRIAALGGDLMKLVGVQNPPLTSFRLDNLLTNMVYDTSATSKFLPTLPYEHKDGIEKTVKWMISSDSRG